MTTQRPYNRPLGFDEAIERLRIGSGVYWDPQVIDVFISWFRTIRT